MSTVLHGLTRFSYLNVSSDDPVCVRAGNFDLLPLPREGTQRRGLLHEPPPPLGKDDEQSGRTGSSIQLLSTTVQ